MFEFYAPAKMRDDPRWISVTEIMRDGVGPTMERLLKVPELVPSIAALLQRVNAVATIKDIELHIEEVAGDDKTVDVVVDNTLLWGRYSGSTETVLNKDLEAIEKATPKGENCALDNLISLLREDRGDLRLTESDFAGSTKGNRF